MSLTMTVIDDDGKVKKYDVETAMTIANVLGFENFEECTGADFADAVIEGLIMTANQRKVCLHGLRQLQQRSLVSDNEVNAILNILMNGGEHIKDESTCKEGMSPPQPKDQSGGPFGGGMNP